MAKLSIPKEMVKSGLLRTGLHGVRKVLKAELGVDFPLTLDDKVKAQLKNDGNMSYPYGWLVPSDAQAVKDQVSGRAVQRTGMRVGTYGATRNTSRVGFIFPVRIGVELHYFDDNADRALHITEALLLISAFTNLNFDVKYGKDFILNTRIEVPDSATIPIADTGDTTKPGAVELTMPLIIHTYAGFFHDVASVYNADPIIGRTISKPGDQPDEFSDEYDPSLPQEFITNDPRSP